MKNWIYILIGILILWVVTLVLGDKRRERLKKKLEELKNERKREWRETMEKERLREYLTRKLNIRARVVSLIVISTFITASIAIGLWDSGQISIEAAFVGVTVMEGLIVIVSQFYMHKPREINYYLGRIEPYLRDKIFAGHIGLDEEIEAGHHRIAILDGQIKRLELKLAA